MKTRNILFLAALASTVLTGCTNDDEAGQGQLPDLSGTPIRIQAGIGEKVLTRTGEDETPQVTVLTEGEFGLFLTTTEAPEDTRYNATNMKFSYTDGGWTSEEQLLWKNSTATVNYYAYMPYTAMENLTEETDGNYSLTVAVQEEQTQVGTISCSAFEKCTALKEVVLGNSVKTLVYNSFCDCTSLKTIDLSQCEEIPGRGWENDNNYAFKDVNKTSITVYVKNAALKTAFEASFWVTHEGFSKDNCQVKQ